MLCPKNLEEWKESGIISCRPDPDFSEGLVRNYNEGIKVGHNTFVKSYHPCL